MPADAIATETYTVRGNSRVVDGICRRQPVELDSVESNAFTGVRPWKNSVHRIGAELRRLDDGEGESSRFGRAWLNIRSTNNVALAAEGFTSEEFDMVASVGSDNVVELTDTASGPDIHSDKGHSRGCC